MNLADSLAAIALFIPGYIGAWTMTFIMSGRKREWSQTLLYSLIFTALTYFILLKLFPYISKTGWDFYGIQKELNLLAALGQEKKVLTFGAAIKLSIPASAVAFTLGYLVGRLRNSRNFREFLGKKLGKTQNNDIWVDYFQRMQNLSQIIILKDGNAVSGPLVIYHDASADVGKGVIVSNPAYIVKPYEAEERGQKPNSYATQGEMLIPIDQIAFIIDMRDQRIADEAKKQKDIARSKSKGKN